MTVGSSKKKSKKKGKHGKKVCKHCRVVIYVVKPPLCFHHRLSDPNNILLILSYPKSSLLYQWFCLQDDSDDEPAVKYDISAVDELPEGVVIAQKKV